MRRPATTPSMACVYCIPKNQVTLRADTMVRRLSIGAHSASTQHHLLSAAIHERRSPETLMRSA